MLQGQELSVMTEMPFAVAGSGVSLLFRDLSKSYFGITDTNVGLWAECSENSDSDVVTACQQSCSGSGTHRLGDIKVCKHSALFGHLIQVRSFVPCRPERANVRISHVVHKDNDHVGGTFLGAVCRIQRKAKKEWEKGELAVHCVVSKEFKNEWSFMLPLAAFPVR